MGKLKNYDGLYGDLNFRKRNDYVFLELIETRSRGFNWVIEKHIHNHLYQFFFIIGGTVDFQGPVKSCFIDTPTILVIPPNTLHGLTFGHDIQIDGSILTISDAMMDIICKDVPAVLVAFSSVQQITFNRATDLHDQKISVLLRDIDHEIFGDGLEKNACLRACFLQLFIQLLRLLPVAVQEEDDRHRFKILKRFHAFQQLLKKADGNRDIPSYANELGITAVHLNRICRQIAGKSALTLLQEHKIERAKNFLIHTAYSISEIAYRLDFSYPNYFARLFRKITGETPSEFRRKVML